MASFFKTEFSVKIWGTMLAIALAGCSFQPDADDAKGESYRADITLTPYGIPHIEAQDWGSLGFGYGYHFLSDNFCVLARHLLRVKGIMSAHFGMEGEQAGNYASDVIVRYFLSDQKMQEYWHQVDARGQALLTGYAAGYNKYRLSIPQGRHLTCRQAAWVQEMTPLDALRLAAYVSNLAVLGHPALAAAIVGVREPSSSISSTDHALQHLADTAAEPEGLFKNMGSNAWGIGSDWSQTGQALLLGNPHYPWHGWRRFYQAHLTIPGELNVMGAAIYGSPMINIGFTEQVAWSHTVSNALRFSLYELTLNPDNLREYEFDGVWLPVRLEKVAVEVLQNGSLSTHNHSLYFTEYGVLLDMQATLQGAPLMNWPNLLNKAYALREVALDNRKIIDQILGMATAADLDDFIAALEEHQGLTFVNTVAASADGDVWYGDISSIPYLTDQQIADCKPSAIGQRLSALLAPIRNGMPVPVLDGSRSSCHWNNDDTAVHNGLLPAKRLAQLRNRDYVANSNDSYWLTNANTPIEGLFQVQGGEDYQVSWRTQMGLDTITGRVEGTDGLGVPGFSSAHLKRLARYSRNGIGERFAADVSALCATHSSVSKTANVQRGCAVISHWDKTNQLDSKGSMLFNTFWQRINRLPNLFDTPFSPDQPIHTPQRLNIEDPEVAQALLDALGAQVDFFDQHQLDPAAKLGELQYVVRNNERIPIDGAQPGTGTLSMIVPIFNNEHGWSEVEAGNSYMQVVTWDEQGQVQAEGILTYSQATDPTSPHYSDQTWLYSQGGWLKLPFYKDEIATYQLNSYSIQN
ncbi:MAG: penicillin acylase family protein [Gammaproteobacteria bacterium]